MTKRCAWSESSEAMREYHDREWGVPERDSRALWEKLILDGFQAGLAWSVILNKRESFRKAFRGFDPAKIARFTERDVERLLADEDIVRSRLKIEATIGNAQSYLDMKRAGEDFSEFVWGFVNGQPVRNPGARLTKSPLSELISKELKKRGFRFVGPTIVYAWMQATGIVDDHEQDCFRSKKMSRGSSSVSRRS